MVGCLCQSLKPTNAQINYIVSQRDQLHWNTVPSMDPQGSMNARQEPMKKDQVNETLSEDTGCDQCAKYR